MDTIAPPFDPQARERTEHVAAALIDLCGRLEDKIDRLVARVDALEQAQDEDDRG